MPKLDGLTLMKGLQNREESRDIPVIFMSGYADDEMFTKAKELGAKFFLAKPFPLEKLDDLIDKILVEEFVVVME